MKAIVQHRYGGPDVLELTDAPDPAPGPDGVLVRIHAAGVNPVDWKVREGYLDGAFPHHFPLIPGWDAAGVVEAVGTAVHEFAPGDEVVGYVRKDHVQLGTYAEYVVGTPRHFAPKPVSVDFATAAGLPLAGLTAMQSLRLSGVERGQTVLVHNASGGVGSFAVQVAIAHGAEVVGTASERNHDYLRSLGATPVTYGDGLADRVRGAAPQGIDASVDYIGSEEAFAVSAELVADKARITSNVDPAAVAEIGGRHCFVRPSAEDLAQLSRLVDAGDVRIEVQEVLPLTDAGRAHELSQDGHVRGKLVLAVD